MSAQLTFTFVASRARRPSRVKLTPEERAEIRMREEIICRSCGLSWFDGCDQPHWMTVDVGRIAMSDCGRCGRTVCHLCYARDDGKNIPGLLCSSCFALPPPSRTDAERHPLTRTHGIRYAAGQLRSTAWRYQAPTGQTCAIQPSLVWFWSIHSAWPDLSEKERNRRFSICAYGEKPKRDDESWCPSWIRENATSTDPGSSGPGENAS